MKETPTLFLIYLLVLLLAACDGGGESTSTTSEPPVENSTEDNSDLFAESRASSPSGDKVNTVGKTINRDAVGKTISTGAGTPGDIIIYEFDRESQLYRAENLTSGLFEEGLFDTYKDPLEKANSDLYHFEKEGSHYYGVELENKFVATNFPGGTELVSIYSGISTKVNNEENLPYYDGSYIVLHLNLKPHDEEDEYLEGMNWGVAKVETLNDGSNSGSLLMKLYNTNEWLPEDVQLEEEFEQMDQEISQLMSGETEFVDDGQVFFGGFAVNEENKETFDTYFINAEAASVAETDEDYIDFGEYFAGMGFASEDESLMIIDLGEGNGYLQLLRITDTEGAYSTYNPTGPYLYIQSDVDFGSGGGFFEVDYADEEYYGTLDIEHFPQDLTESGVEESRGLILEKTLLPCIYFTDFKSVEEYGADDGMEEEFPSGERMYFITNYDFVMHFTIDMSEEGGKKLLNFGVGAYSPE